MADTAEYLVIYKRFFDDFAATVNPDDQLPVKVAGYYLYESELVGEIVDWTLQYLNQKNCPPSLVAPITRIVIEEIKQACKKQPQLCGYRPQDNSYQPLKLMQAVTGKVNEVCLRYQDNGCMTTLPAPTPGPPISTCAIKNARRRMEDRHVIIEDFHAVFNIQDQDPASYYAVFDGHAGTDAAVYSVSHLHQFLAESSYYPTDPVQALRDAFFRTDTLFIEKSNRENLRSGTTAVCALLRPKEKKLYVAWLGDSQALLVSEGDAVQVVNPHKPDRVDERERIEEMGGCVLYWGTWRVNGQLAVSRAIGDLEYKPYVTAEPDVRAVDLTGTEDFLLLACDGLWDFVSEKEAVVAVYEQLKENPDDLEAVSQRLVQLSKQQGSTDNISVIIVFLTDPAQLASRPLDVPRQWPSLNNGMDNATSNNPFTNGADAVAGQKLGLLLDLGIGGDADSYKQNGTSPDMFFLERASNGKVAEHEDLGPETDVDAVDDAQLNNNPFGADEEIQQQQLMDLDSLKEPRQDTPTPPVDEVPGVAGLVPDNVAESGEDSEDEWNYYRVDPSGNTPVEIESQPNQPVCQKPTSLQGELVPSDSADSMESQLNPNAAEFIPSPTSSSRSVADEILLLEKAVPSIDAEEVKLPDLLNGQPNNSEAKPNITNGSATETKTVEVDKESNLLLKESSDSVGGLNKEELVIPAVVGQELIASTPNQAVADSSNKLGHEFNVSNSDNMNKDILSAISDDSSTSDSRGLSDEGSNLSGFRGFSVGSGNTGEYRTSFQGIFKKEIDTSVFDSSCFLGFAESAEYSRSGPLLSELDILEETTSSESGLSPTNTGDSLLATAMDKDQNDHILTTEGSEMVTESVNILQKSDVVMHDMLEAPIHISFELQKDLVPEMEAEPERVKVNSDDASPVLESRVESSNIPFTVNTEVLSPVPCEELTQGHKIDVDVESFLKQESTDKSQNVSVTGEEIRCHLDDSIPLIPSGKENEEIAPLLLGKDSLTSEIVNPMLETNLPVLDSFGMLPPGHPLNVCVFPLGPHNPVEEAKLLDDVPPTMVCTDPLRADDAEHAHELGNKETELHEHVQLVSTPELNLSGEVQCNGLASHETFRPEFGHPNEVEPYQSKDMDEKPLLLDHLEGMVPLVTQTPPPTPASTVDTVSSGEESKHLMEAAEKLSGEGEGQVVTAAATVAATVATAVAAGAVISDKKPQSEDAKKDASVPLKKTAVKTKKSLTEKAKVPSKPAASLKAPIGKTSRMLPPSPTKPASTTTSSKLLPKKPPATSPSIRQSKPATSTQSKPATSTGTTSTLTSRPKTAGVASKPTTTLRSKLITTSLDKPTLPSGETGGKPVPKRPEQLVAKKETNASSTRTLTRPLTAPAGVARTAVKTAPKIPPVARVPRVAASGPASKPKVPVATSQTKLSAQTKVVNAKEGKETVNKQISSSRSLTKAPTNATRNVALSTVRKVETKTTGTAKVTVAKTSTTLKTTAVKLGTKKTTQTATCGSSTEKAKSTATTENRELVSVEEISSEVITTNEVKCDQALNFD